MCTYQAPAECSDHVLIPSPQDSSLVPLRAFITHDNRAGRLVYKC